MSVFVLRLIAIVTMMIDHLGFALQATNKINEEQARIMRTIGRTAYPTFAFLIVNGWKYTSDKKKYLRNMLIFAGVSQIPFTLAIGNFASAKQEVIQNTSFLPNSFHLDLSNFDSLGFIIIMIAGYIYFIWKDQKDWTIVPAIVSIVIPFVTYYWERGIFLLLPGLNIFYTLTIGMMVIASLEKVFNHMKAARTEQTAIDISDEQEYSKNNSDYMTEDISSELEDVSENEIGTKMDVDDSSAVVNKANDFGIVETLFLIMITAFAIYLIQGRADYGYLGLVLIAGLYITRKFKFVQMLIFIVWAYIFYYLRWGGIAYMAAASIPAVLILLYNEKKGPSLKYLFYAFYPVHLLVLGIYSCYSVFLNK